MAKLGTPRYTLVQHSAWVVKRDPRFQHQVEQAAITTEAELGRIINLGGRIFDTYLDAEDAVDETNNPTGPDGQPSSPTLTFAETCHLGGRPLCLPGPEGNQ